MNSDLPYAFHVDDLYKMRNKKAEREFKAYSRMLEGVYKRIMMVEKMNKSDTMYEVPAFIIGMPLYSREYAINYILHNLNNSGFKCTYMGEAYIYINWGHTKKGVRMTENQKKLHDKQKRYEVKRRVHAPEYKEFNGEIAHELPQNLKNSTIHIHDPVSLLHSVQNNKPDFSVESLRRIRQTANEIQDYR